VTSWYIAGIYAASSMKDNTWYLGNLVCIANGLLKPSSVYLYIYTNTDRDICMYIHNIERDREIESFFATLGWKGGLTDIPHSEQQNHLIWVTNPPERSVDVSGIFIPRSPTNYGHGASQSAAFASSWPVSNSLNPSVLSMLMRSS